MANIPGLPYADALIGYVREWVTLSSNYVVDQRIQMYSGFVQDDWRVTNKLTLNLGLRYDFAQRLSIPATTSLKISIQPAAVRSNSQAPVRLAIDRWSRSTRPTSLRASGSPILRTENGHSRRLRYLLSSPGTVRKRRPTGPQPSTAGPNDGIDAGPFQDPLVGFCSRMVFRPVG